MTAGVPRRWYTCIDPALKRDAEAILHDVGLTPSAAVTLFYKQIVRLGVLPLDLARAAPLPPPATTPSVLQEARPSDPQMDAAIERLDQLTRMKGL